jgi:hypothetical protein
MSKCTPCEKKYGKQIIKINDITRLNHYVRSSQLNMLPIKFQFYSHYIKVPFYRRLLIFYIIQIQHAFTNLNVTRFFFTRSTFRHNLSSFKVNVQPFSFIFMKTHFEYTFLSVKQCAPLFI